MDALLASMGSQKAKPYTRWIAGVNQSTLKPWSSVFELVGTKYWMAGGLDWTEGDWISFCKQTCKFFDLEKVLLRYFVLKEPAVFVPKEEGAKETEAARNRKAKRLATIAEEASVWRLDTHNIAVELVGDSQVVVHWLLGLWRTSNKIYEKNPA